MNSTDNAYDFDLAVSYAGVDHQLVHGIVACLEEKAPSLRIFCYQYSDLISDDQDLFEALSLIYRKKSRFCLVFVSDHYTTRYTDHEYNIILGRYYSGDKEAMKIIRISNLDLADLYPRREWGDLRLMTLPAFIEKVLNLFGPELIAPSRLSPFFDSLWPTQGFYHYIIERVERFIISVAKGKLTYQRRQIVREINEPEVISIFYQNTPIAFVSFEIDFMKGAVVVIRTGTDFDNWPRNTAAIVELGYNEPFDEFFAILYDICLGDSATPIKMIPYEAVARMLEFDIMKRLNKREIRS